MVSGVRLIGGLNSSSDGDDPMPLSVRRDREMVRRGAEMDRIVEMVKQLTPSTSPESKPSLNLTPLNEVGFLTRSSPL